MILRVLQIALGCSILTLFLSLCLYEDRDGFSWVESLNKIEHPTWKHGYVLCGDRTVVYRGYEQNKEYFELLEIAKRECGDE